MAIATDWAAVVGTAVVVGAVTYFFNRMKGGFDARAAAEAAIVAAGPAIITQLNARAQHMQEEINRLWARDRECQDDLDKMRQVINERDYALRELEQKNIILERRLARLERESKR